MFRTFFRVVRRRCFDHRILSRWIHPSSKSDVAEDIGSSYDVVVVGAGHNGLVAASYLSKAGLRVAVAEKRAIVGGAAVTEEIVPGFRFSRASYVLSLLRPEIIRELELKKHGLKVYLRNPTSYTPILDSRNRPGQPRSLTLWSERSETVAEIAKFSRKDARVYPEYEKYLEKLASAIHPLMDNPPADLAALTSRSLKDKLRGLLSLKSMAQAQMALREDTLPFYELLTSSAVKILDQWFESEPLRSTLATDGVIGAMQGPNSPGSSYVLLHHVMGELEGVKGAWGYPEGGMGAVTRALAEAATSYGTRVVTSAAVREIIVEDGVARGVVLTSGRRLASEVVLSNATPKVTFLDLLSEGVLSEQHRREIARIDYASPVTKINLALKRLPDFLADPNVRPEGLMPHHRSTIHLNCENMALLNDAYVRGQRGLLPDRPMIEMVLPSSLDPTIAPEGCHVCLMFTQYTPYKLADGRPWDDATKEEYLDIVLDNIEEYAPGFRASVIGGEVLSPVDLEDIFGLTGGNIFHGAMSLDQMFFARPMTGVTSPKTPVRGLYLCGSGAHPGGGVMGSPGKICARTVLQHFKK